MAEGEPERSVNLTFKGDKDQWRMWKAKALAVAHIRGFLRAYTHQDPLPVTDTDLEPTTKTPESEAKALSLRISEKANMDAFTFLILNCTGTAFLLVEQCVSTRAPMGDAHDAWKSLLAKYEPRERGEALTTVLNSFETLTLSGIEEDPATFINEMTYLNHRMKNFGDGHGFSDYMFKLHLM
jgi:hypothetical protein